MKRSIELRGLGFKARHAVAFPKNQNEPDGSWFREDFHWHDFHVSAKIVGPLDVAGCVVDFRVALAALKELLAKLDGRAIVSRANQPANGENLASSADRIVRLERENASAEIIAEELLKAWLKKLDFDPQKRYSVSLSLEEEPGCFAEVEMDTEEVADWRNGAESSAFPLE